MSPPEPNTIEELIADARMALAAGNATRAVELLEQAYEKDSTDVRVRIELGNALYSKHGLDLLALRSAAGVLVEPSDSTSASESSRSGAGEEVCTRGAEPDPSADRYRQVRMDADPLRRLADRTSVVKRVRRLVVEGVFERRSATFDSTSVRVRRKGLLVRSVTVITSQLLETRQVLGASGRSLFFDREGQPSQAFVACAGSESVLARSHDALCALSDATRRGLQWIRDRNRLAGRDETSVLISRLETVAHAGSARTNCS
ncbi:MAG: hypothetical protein ABEL51_09425 [Salinibacter sp.]